MKNWQKFFTVVLLLLLPLVAGAAQTDPDASSLLQEGRVDDAIATLQGRISRSPNDAAAYNLLCRSYLTLRDWDRGISACEKAVLLAPDNSWYHLWLGRIYGEGGGKDKAAAQAETLSKLDPAKAHWVDGRLAEKKKDLATAEKEYRAAIDVSHGSANSWLNLALFYRRAGRLDDMENAIRHASSAQMNQPEVLVDAAVTLVRAGRDLPAAIQLLRRYLSSNSTVEQAPAFRAHYLLGTLLEKEGDKQAAAQEYRAALSMARGFSQAQTALSRLNQ
jgi:tetratricopeptide (TPR) repeat protein